MRPTSWTAAAGACLLALVSGLPTTAGTTDCDQQLYLDLTISSGRIYYEGVDNTATFTVDATLSTNASTGVAYTAPTTGDELYVLVAIELDPSHYYEIGGRYIPQNSTGNVFTYQISNTTTPPSPDFYDVYAYGLPYGPDNSSLVYYAETGFTYFPNLNDY